MQSHDDQTTKTMSIIRDYVNLTGSVLNAQLSHAVCGFDEGQDLTYR
jgi:hypothetical protein